MECGLNWCALSRGGQEDGRRRFGSRASDVTALSAAELLQRSYFDRRESFSRPEATTSPSGYAVTLTLFGPPVILIDFVSFGGFGFGSAL